MTVEDYDALMEKQNGQCAICKTNELTFGRGLVVDHNHKTGQIRGLLCSHCNVILGHANDDTKVLASAIQYLESTYGPEAN